MGQARTHISISSNTYKKAKAIQKRYAAMGVVITMENALYFSKKETEENSFKGWKI